MGRDKKKKTKLCVGRAELDWQVSGARQLVKGNQYRNTVLGMNTLVPVVDVMLSTDENLRSFLSPQGALALTGITGMYQKVVGYH